MNPTWSDIIVLGIGTWIAIEVIARWQNWRYSRRNRSN